MALTVISWVLDTWNILTHSRKYQEDPVSLCVSKLFFRVLKHFWLNLRSPLYWSFLAEINHFFLHFFATRESLFWRFLVKVKSCGHFLVSAKAVTWFVILVINLRQMIYRLSSNFSPKGASNNYKSLHFVQSCISKAVLWPPILICVRSLFLRTARVWGRCKRPVAPGQSPGGDPGAKPWKLWKQSNLQHHKGV